jgi:UDP-2,4-diacetamido-2,4,6-trideoxy-beta-L-altropyranose hydrolase
MSSAAETSQRASVVIRVDASAQMGVGHLQRCMTLADVLRTRGVRSKFVCRSLPEQLAKLIGNKGHDFVPLPIAGTGRSADVAPAHANWLGASQVEDAFQTANSLSGDKPDWLVVDHYAIDVRWEAAMRPFAKKIFVIDDLADRPHDCDLLLDQNYYIDAPERYSGLVPAACRQMLGPRYALLRPEFSERRDTKSERDGKVARILIFFGGADTHNYTKLALDALDGMGRSDLSVDVVVGLMNPHHREIEAACARRANTRFFSDVANMAQLMAEAHVALGAGGSASWERCSVGLPALAVVTAENQRHVIDDLCDFGAVLSPSCESGDNWRVEFMALLGAMLSCSRLLRGMARRCRELVDGLGAQRVATAIIGGDLSLRLATESDCKQVYEWRHHPDIRDKSRVSAPFSFESHRQWYAEALRNPDRMMLIAECLGQPISVVRFDISGDSAEISVYVAPDRLGEGWGAEVLTRATVWLQKHRSHVREIVAEVLWDNLASRGAFRRAGYRETKVTFARSLPPI